MAAKPPFILHQTKHQHPDDSRQAKDVHLPIIPDLRFEHSYLRSIQPYVTIRHVPPAYSETANKHLYKFGKVKTAGKLQPSVLSNLSSEVVHIRWGRVAWITTRDQIISPLIQGALWALVSYWLTPFSAQLRTQMGTFGHPPSKEGAGVGWLRFWTSRLGFGGMGMGIR